VAETNVEVNLEISEAAAGEPVTGWSFSVGFVGDTGWKWVWCSLDGWMFWRGAYVPGTEGVNFGVGTQYVMGCSNDEEGIGGVGNLGGS
jgi:hypothetical protein